MNSGCLTEVRKLTVGEFFNRREAAALLEEYADESAIAGMPTPRPDVEMYSRMENLGSYFLFCAFLGDGKLIGFAGLMVTPNPHYSAVIGSIESIFVSKEHRSSGAGLGLIAAAKKAAKVQGAVGLFSSATRGSALEAVYERMDCNLTNKVFFWGFR